MRISKSPSWWSCEPESSSLDLPGGKSLANPQDGITIVAKLMLRIEGTDKVACWFRRSQPEASRLNQAAKEETLGETMLREAKEELVLPESVLSALGCLLKEVPAAHSDGTVCTPGGDNHRVHCWVLEVSEEEANQVNQSEEGAREGEDFKFRPVKDLMKNVLRTGRPTYAHLMGKAWHRAKSLPPRVFVRQSESKSMSLGCITLTQASRARPGELECHPMACEPASVSGKSTLGTRPQSGPLLSEVARCSRRTGETAGAGSWCPRDAELHRHGMLNQAPGRDAWGW